MDDAQLTENFEKVYNKLFFLDNELILRSASIDKKLNTLLAKTEITMLHEVKEELGISNHWKAEMEGLVAKLKTENSELIAHLLKMEKSFNQVKAEADDYKESYEQQTIAVEINRERIREMREEMAEIRKKLGEI